MYSDKRSVLELAALMRAHGIRRVVVCPGSRNIPLVRTFMQMEDMTCYPVTDERSAGFFALGLALESGKEVAVCCTSGTALLNLYPAVAEAYYQQLPLLVISADRPTAWIGQRDGQTLPQAGVFGAMVKKSVSLPDIHTSEDAWFCNRIINEAILEMQHRNRGPVHINVPLGEPLFCFSEQALPNVRIMKRHEGFDLDRPEDVCLADALLQYGKRMVIAGQMRPCGWKVLPEAFVRQFVWVTEHIGNACAPRQAIGNADAVIWTLRSAQKAVLQPDLLITYGGHIVSKSLKSFLRAHPPKAHWHVSENGEVADLFGSLTRVIEMSPAAFLAELAPCLESVPTALEAQTTSFVSSWMRLSQSLPEPVFPYSAMGAIGTVIKRLPMNSVLHLANSSTIRYAQLFLLPKGVEVCANRGTNGIEGSLSTAVGYASASDKVHVVMVGDLSFFYDMNALWNGNYGCNIRILLLNNGGGEIFGTLPGLEMDEKAAACIKGRHDASARAWAQDRGFLYLAARDQAAFDAHLPIFTAATDSDKPILLEVFTDEETDIRLFKQYYHHLKSHHYGSTSMENH